MSTTLKHNYRLGAPWGRTACLGEAPLPVVASAVEYAFRYHLGFSSQNRLSIDVESINVHAQGNGRHKVRFKAYVQPMTETHVAPSEVCFAGCFDDGVLRLQLESV